MNIVEKNKKNLKENILEMFFTFAGTKKQGFKYYSSLTDFVSAIHKYTRIAAPGNIREAIKDLLNEGVIRYENEHFEMTEWRNIDPFTIQRLPDYFLLTNKLKDQSQRLSYDDYKVMLYIDFHFRHRICPMFEECRKAANLQGKTLWASEIEYSSSESIGRATGYSKEKIRRILRNLRFYFGEKFYYKPDEFERNQREHHWSRTNTINLPPRKEWKRIIEGKLDEILDDKELDLPRFVYYDQWSQWKKIHDKEEKNGLPKYMQLRLSSFLAMKEHNKSQNEKLQEGLEEWKDQKESWELYKTKIINELETMRLDGLICEMIENRIITKLHSTRDISKMDKLLDLVVENCDDIKKLIDSLNSLY